MPAQRPGASGAPPERGTAPHWRNGKPISRQQMAAFDTGDWSASYLVPIQPEMQQTVRVRLGSGRVIGAHLVRLSRYSARLSRLARNARTRAPRDAFLCGTTCRGPRAAHPPARPNRGQFGGAARARRSVLSSPLGGGFPRLCGFCGRGSRGNEALSRAVRRRTAEQGSAMSA